MYKCCQIDTNRTVLIMFTVTVKCSPSVLCSSSCSQFIMMGPEQSVRLLVRVLVLWSEYWSSGLSTDPLVWVLMVDYKLISPVSTGRLYQSHNSRGQNLLQDPRPGSLLFSRTSTLPPPPSSTSSAPPSKHSNYQNCTIIQSHLPCSSYGTYVTLAPKTLIFPVFVQVRTINLNHT